MTAWLQTERLVLDAPGQDDISDVLEACTDPETQRWVPLPTPYTRAEAAFFVDSYCPHGIASGRYTVWALHPLGGGRMLGALEVRRDEQPGTASLGCWLAPWARRQGFMREALSAVARYALSPDGLALERLHWEYLPGNEASRRLAEAVGFVFRDDLRRTVSLHDEAREALIGTLNRNGVGG
jgi:RimJ/RimL family protein N-acetyltransferase